MASHAEASVGSDDHAARMDAIYRTQRHFYDLTRKYYLLGRDKMIANLDAGPSMRVLEVGCGTGRNLIAAARRWPDTHFTGLDISAEMLASAHISVARQGMTKRISLVEADACAIASHPQLEGERFDRIFMSYTLSMIPGWETAIQQALAMLAPQGSLHIVDFGQQERLPRWFRKLLFAWLRKFHVRPRPALSLVLEALAHERGRQLHFNPSYRGYAWEAVLRPA